MTEDRSRRIDALLAAVLKCNRVNVSRFCSGVEPRQLLPARRHHRHPVGNNPEIGGLDK